jgi:hypothetical protein
MQHTVGVKHGNGVRLIMWHTSRGDRTLLGAEGFLVGHAIETLIDSLMMHYDTDMDEESAFQCESGIAVFDSLSTSQRLALLHDVANHLLTPTESALPLSATAEAAVAAVFVEIRDQVAIEIGFQEYDEEKTSDIAPCAVDPDNMSWRELVIAAHHCVFGDRFSDDLASDFDGEIVPRLTPSSRDMDSWELLIEHLTDAILWDRDFEMADSFLDIDPSVSQRRRRLLGIEDDYFTNVVADPRHDEVMNLVSRARDIVRRKPR